MRNHVLRETRPKDARTLLLLQLQFFLSKYTITVLGFFLSKYTITVLVCYMPPDAGLQKTTNFSALIVGQAGDQAQAHCVALSGPSAHRIYSGDRLNPANPTYIPSTNTRSVHKKLQININHINSVFSKTSLWAPSDILVLDELLEGGGGLNSQGTNCK
jgi:hypothetical protein